MIQLSVNVMEEMHIQVGTQDLNNIHIQNPKGEKLVFQSKEKS